jgi:ABC-type uncharacterized transport system substrate-binding protein
MSAYKGQSSHRADIVSPSLDPEPDMRSIEQLTLCFSFQRVPVSPCARAMCYFQPVCGVVAVAGRCMRRREFITLLGGAATAWPLAASAQQPIPAVGFLNGASPTELGSRVVAFRDGLAEKGYVEGHSVAIEYRWGSGQYERLPEMAIDLVRHRVAVIAATGGVPSVRAAKAATSEIPIVFTMGGDPVAFGLVASLNRPGSNVTGITLISGEIVSKRIALLRDLLPAAKTLGVLMNSTAPASAAEVAAAERVAHTLGWYGAAYSITLSARDRNDSEIVRSSALAVLRLTSSSKRVGCWTGSSPGLAPLRTLST